MAPYDFDEIMKHKLVRLESESELLGQEAEPVENTLEIRPSVSKVRTVTRGLRYFAALAAVLVLVFTAFMVDGFRITDELCLDVNPSVRVSLNRAGHVVKTEGMNADGETVVASIGNSINKAKDPVSVVRLLVDEIDREGYFSNNSADIIISMGISKEDKKDILDSVVKSLEEFTDEKGLQKTLVVLVYQKSKDLDKKSTASAISPGKYVFLSKLAEKTDIDVEEFKDKSVREINEYIKSYKGLHDSDDITLIEEKTEEPAEIPEKEPASEEDKEKKEKKDKGRDKDSSGNEGENKDSASGKNNGKSDKSQASEDKKPSDNKSSADSKKNKSSDKKSDKAAAPEKKKTDNKKSDKEKANKEKSKDKKPKDNKSSEKNNKEEKGKSDPKTEGSD